MTNSASRRRLPPGCPQCLWLERRAPIVPARHSGQCPLRVLSPPAMAAPRLPAAHVLRQRQGRDFRPLHRALASQGELARREAEERNGRVGARRATRENRLRGWRAPSSCPGTRHIRQSCRRGARADCHPRSGRAARHGRARTATSSIETAICGSTRALPNTTHETSSNRGRRSGARAGSSPGAQPFAMSIGSMSDCATSPRAHTSAARPSRRGQPAPAASPSERCPLELFSMALQAPLTVSPRRATRAASMASPMRSFLVSAPRALRASSLLGLAHRQHGARGGAHHALRDRAEEQMLQA